MAYCKLRKKQGVGSTISWRPRLCNYKSHIKKIFHSCKVVTPFMDECFDEEIPFKYLKFVIIDVVNITSGLKHNLCIGTVVTQHQGSNNTRDSNCLKEQKEKKSITDSRKQ